MAVIAVGLRSQALARRQPYHLLLPFLCVWLIKPFYQGNRLDWIALALAVPLFVALYALAHASRPWRGLLGLSGLTLLGAFYVPFNPEASGIFAFVASIYAAGKPRWRVLWAYLLGINVLLLAEALLFHLNLWTWIGGGSGALLFTLIVLLNSRERETNLQLQLAQNEIGRLAKLGERERITRDLHDVLGHTLSLIAMKSELAQKRFRTEPALSLVEAKEIEVMSREALVRVRSALHGYPTASFQKEVDRIEAALRSVGLEVRCQLDEVALTSMQESVLGMVLQEAATNIMRHAYAGLCEIRLHATQDGVSLIVTDNGRSASDYHGFGLRGMAERLSLLGGSLQVTGGQGTRLEASLPRS